MADAVERTLAEDRVLLCEAGTGTGKTLAYLVPAILSGLRVVVATATKALQEQIVHKDLPLIERHLGLEPRAVLVKGLANYLCRRRLEELRQAPSSEVGVEAHHRLPLLESWMRETETGDVSELSALAEGDSLWAQVSSSSETRIGSGCEHYEPCFVTRLKRQLGDASLLVVNHHLFFADLAVKSTMGAEAAGRGGALPPYDAVIFDEAHRLEDIATEFFGVRLSRPRVESMLRDADRAFVASGLADRLLGKGEGTALTALVREASHAFFDAVASAASTQSGEDGRALLPRDAFVGARLSAYHRLDDALDVLEQYAETHAVSEAVDLVRRRAARVRDEVSRIVDPATHQIAWVRRSTAGNLSVGASPVDLGPMLRSAVFEQIGAVVLTSATLTTPTSKRRPEPEEARPFGFLRQRMGLTAELDVPVDELEVASPFDYATRALLYTPRDLPEPNSPAFHERATERARELVSITGGGAFVLCTSTRAVRTIARGLRESLGRRLLVQGEAPKRSLIARFRDGGHEVLVATMSFWEGVDVPGDALRLVVLDRLPFAVPTDPVVSARCAAIEEAGGNAFSDYSVPQAAILLKQGFGRLIRTSTDRGIVAILDPRLRRRSYGSALLRSLPPATQTEALDDVKTFWRRLTES